MARPKATESLRKARREQIQKAALKVFSEKGYHATGIADIAAEVNLGHGTFYRYFANKLDIMLSLIEDILIQMKDIAEEEIYLKATSRAEYLQAMYMIAMKYSSIFLSSPAIVKIFFREAHADPAIAKEIELTLQYFHSVTEKFLTHGRKLNLIDPELNLPDSARLINAMIFETLRSFSEEDTLSATRMVQTIIRLIPNALQL
ncbi:MAG: TetR/AcrR family transcriptional regulator [Leptospiraceae bacterium]|nr:TetR/AcrR family transcriptional regulator [Leptospiraceae bacterium]